MSLNYENVGKEVIYNRSVDNIEDYVKGTIVGCYIGQDEEYYITSIESSGECIKVYDDSLIEIISGGGGSSTDSNAVHYTADSNKTDEEKAQARTNIGAGTADLFVITLTESGGVYSADKTYDEIIAAIESNKVCIAVDGDYVGHLMLNDSADLFFVCTYENNSRLYDCASDDSWNLFVTKLENKPKTVTDTISTSITLASVTDNTFYTYGTLTSLTITSFPSTGKFWIVFVSGATPTVVTGIDNFTPEANKRYRIYVENGYATFDSWPTGGVV